MPCQIEKQAFKVNILFKTKYNKYFKKNLKVYNTKDFIAKLAQRIPFPMIRLTRYFDLADFQSEFVESRDIGHPVRNAVLINNISSMLRQSCSLLLYSSLSKFLKQKLKHCHLLFRQYL
jgi:hypothetical protein